MSDVSARLDASQQSLLQESITFDERSVGAMMSRDAIALRDSLSVSEVLTELRGLEALPGHTDRIFIVAVPLGLQRAGRDPAQGASVLLTLVTDSMGFLLFLGLATAFLV